MFQRLKSAIFGGRKKSCLPQGICIEVKEYEVHKEEITEKDWEKQFQEYSNFDFQQSGKNYKLRLHFRESETRKEEITQFVKDGMNATKGNLQMVIINVNVIYNLGVATRGIKEDNQVLLFFNWKLRRGTHILGALSVYIAHPYLDCFFI